MKNLLAIGVAFLLSLLPSCGAGASAAGVYEIDKDAFKAMIMKDKDAMPEEMVKAMLDKMVMSMDLKADGTAVATIKMMGMDQSGTGTWKLEGDKMSMTMKGKDGKEETKVAKYASGVITVDEEEGGKKMQMVLRRK